MSAEQPASVDHALFNELRHDVKEMVSTLTEIKEQFKFWLPKWEQHTHGMMRLDNEQSSLKNQVDKHREFVTAELQKMRDEIAAEKKADDKLEEVAKAARDHREQLEKQHQERMEALEKQAKDEKKEEAKDRRVLIMWIVGAGFTALSVAIALASLLISHVSIK